MISDTLSEGLASYRIGPKVRDLRAKKALGLVQLGEHTGLSPGMLSKIERGQVFPTLPTLLRIAMVFGVGLDHFFTDTEDRPEVAIVRRADRVRLPDRSGATAPSYLFESLDFPASDRRMEAFLAEFPEGAEESEPHSHSGAELIYVMRGALMLRIMDAEIVLEEGDAVYFDSAASHSYRQGGRGTCSAIVVVAV